ncbi:P-loop containing nucleoside triphosphate hydrolase protein [Pholiota conissans]|uniref:RNA helicase n=1 Tax=Pholiota conissans TaxID=109636 RepID=A0A9P5YZ94_9AGAR|nr:P-loop containing nucleoside triphosphate hydrolase protein [Pholiota conissans]
MSSLLSRCVHSGIETHSCSRRALLHTSTILSKDRLATRPADDSRRQGSSNKKGKGVEHNERFQRDELPHSGRTPVSERSRRVEVRPRSSERGKTTYRSSRSGESSREGPPTTGGYGRAFEQRGPQQRDTYSSRSTDTRNSSSKTQSFDKGRSQDSSRSEKSNSRYTENLRGDRRPSQDYSSGRHQPESLRAESQRSTSYLSQVTSAISLTTDSTTFGDSREDREIEEGAYDTPEVADEFFHPPEPVTLASTSAQRKEKEKSSLDTVQSAFTAPPLLPGFVSALKEMFGPNAQPTPIQSLSISHCLPSKPVEGAPGWKQFLLASETGSGKSIAYLLPLLQGIKNAELAELASGAKAQEKTPAHAERLLNPRGLVLAPTHELARQLSGFAKSLLHDVKLRVLCASRANEKSTAKKTDTTSAAQMAALYSETSNGEGALEVKRQAHPVSVVVGTPMKLLEMVRGRGWDRVEEDETKAAAEEEEDGLDEEGKPRVKPRRGRDKMVHYGTWRAKPELGLANVEWVVVDEADVLFDPDFQETTRTLLADISAARGHALPASASIPVPPALGQPTSPTTLSNPMPTTVASTATSTAITPIDYPFNLILTSATIPKSLNTYLSQHHPSLVRLASPALHRLPKTLQTEYVGWTGGNKFADVVRRIRRVWAEDAATGKGQGKDAELSKVLVFCNRSAKVVEFAAYLETQGVKSVAMTSRSEQRGRGSNRHLDGFLRIRSHSPSAPPSQPTPADPKAYPHVLITTSLLSRGLDFSPEIKHVFIVDEPRNTVDFLHRAGRTGRAGEWGKVVIFGKMKGRGSARTKEVRKRIQGLRA